MKTDEIRFQLPKGILTTLNQNIDEFTRQVRLSAALQLFKDHKLSFGKASELAGISKEKFLMELDQNNINFISYDPSELEDELEYMKR